MTLKAAVQSLARVLLWLEPLLLALIILAFWYPTPTRTYWLWTLALLLPVYVARYFVYSHFLTRSPFDLLFLLFLVLGVINVYAAPYTRGLMMLARPLLGTALVYAMIEKARLTGSMRGPLQTIIMLALLVGLLAMGSTQWNNKSTFFQPIIDALPTIQGFPGAESGFNANEIAGALAWLVPLLSGLLILRWREKGTRWDVTLAFVLLTSALILGQSRSAILGVIVALLLLTPLLLPQDISRMASRAESGRGPDPGSGAHPGLLAGGSGPGAGHSAGNHRQYGRRPAGHLGQRLGDCA